MKPTADSTTRFTDRVTDYVRYRPGYPDALAEALHGEVGFGPSSTVADIGSGTGISSELLLRLGCEVFAVEPNAAMRQAAETRFAGNAKFHSLDATAEATTLASGSVDGIAAGKAFHWFDAAQARTEFGRILTNGGVVALFWNNRRTDTSEFLRDYERLLHQFGTDYREVDHRNVGPARLREFFRADFQTRTFRNEQIFDFAGLRGRLLSSSYAPSPTHPNCGPMLEALQRLFDEHQVQGQVRFEYDTELFFGPLRSDG